MDNGNQLVEHSCQPRTTSLAKLFARPLLVSETKCKEFISPCSSPLLYITYIHIYQSTKTRETTPFRHVHAHDAHNQKIPAECIMDTTAEDILHRNLDERGKWILVPKTPHDGITPVPTDGGASPACSIPGTGGAIFDCWGKTSENRPGKNRSSRLRVSSQRCTFSAFSDGGTR